MSLPTMYRIGIHRDHVLLFHLILYMNNQTNIYKSRLTTDGTVNQVQELTEYALWLKQQIKEDTYILNWFSVWILFDILSYWLKYHF